MNLASNIEFEKIIDWLLAGDVSIQFQVQRDLLGNNREDLRERISIEGWGSAFLSHRKNNGHWGIKFYQPKWTSTHYTILDLRNLYISPGDELIKESVDKIVRHEKGPDGGINPSNTIKNSDVCLNGMFLNYASYFKTDQKSLETVVDFILSQIMTDGGFNCRFNRSGARHSSLHSTLSVLEGVTEYELNEYKYRLEELKQAVLAAREFILAHQLYLSDRTGKIIHKDFLRLSYPRRWRYDILSALDYFRYANLRWDDRMKPAINVLLEKRNKDGTWNLQAKIPGQTHFDMENAGKPSRWNTLRALRVLKHFEVL